MNKKINSDLQERVRKFMELQQLLAEELGLTIPTEHGKPFIVYDIKGQQLLEVEMPKFTEIKYQKGKTEYIQHDRTSNFLKPRSIHDTDGIACMPLKENVPTPKDSQWELTTCPKCGCECWATPTLKALQQVHKVQALCTKCTLSLGKE